jgi:hypothetical protein
MVCPGSLQPPHRRRDPERFEVEQVSS